MVRVGALTGALPLNLMAPLPWRYLLSITGCPRTAFDKPWCVQGSPRLSSMAIEVGDLRKLRKLQLLRSGGLPMMAVTLVQSQATQRLLVGAVFVWVGAAYTRHITQPERRRQESARRR